MNARLNAALLTVVCMVATSPLAATIVIDNYTAGGTLFRFGAGSVTQITTSSDILGGTRDDLLVVPVTGNEFFGAVGFDGDVQIAQGASDQVSGSFTYDDFAPLDLTENGVNRAFVFNVSSVDSVSPISDVFSITVSDGSVVSTHNFDLPGNENVPGLFTVTFDNFTGGVDFSNIESIVLAYDFASSPGSDVAIDSFGAAIPEPGHLSIIGGLSLLAICRRRKQR